MRQLLNVLNLNDLHTNTIHRGICTTAIAVGRYSVTDDFRNMYQNSPDEKGYLNFFEYDLGDDISELMYTHQLEMFQEARELRSSFALKGTSLQGYRDEWRTALWQQEGDDPFTQEALMGLECLEAIAKGMA